VLQVGFCGLTSAFSTLGFMTARGRTCTDAVTLGSVEWNGKGSAVGSCGKCCAFSCASRSASVITPPSPPRRVGDRLPPGDLPAGDLAPGRPDAFIPACAPFTSGSGDAGAGAGDGGWGDAAFGADAGGVGVFGTGAATGAGTSSLGGAFAFEGIVGSTNFRAAGGSGERVRVCREDVSRMELGMAAFQRFSVRCVQPLPGKCPQKWPANPKTSLGRCMQWNADALVQQPLAGASNFECAMTPCDTSTGPEVFTRGATAPPRTLGSRRAD